MIDNALEIENRLEQLILTLLREHEYVEFLVGRDGEFDQLVSSTIRRCKREYRNDNSAHIWVLPYITAEFRDNEESFRDYYDEIEVCEAAAGGHYKKSPPDPKPGHGGQIRFDCVLHPARKRRCMADHEVCQEAGQPLHQP